jgi:hypothetical protein
MMAVIGPSDLRLDLGLPLTAPDNHPVVEPLLKKATMLSKKYKVPLLGFCFDGDQLKTKIDEGFRYEGKRMKLHLVVFNSAFPIG